MNILEEKLEKLRTSLEKYDRIGVAFSGGVDSTFLLAFISAMEGKKPEVIGMTVNAPNFAPDEIAYARQFCADRDIRHLIIDIDFDNIDGFKENSKERCYFCKKSIFSHVKKIAGEQGIHVIADGTNLDDDLDYRPGKKALLELGVISPLKDALLTKNEIRQALKALGVSIWDKPAYACLASRIPYGVEITEDKLLAIYQVEKTIRNLGFSQVRVRHHGEIARIELLPQDIPVFVQPDILSLVQTAAISAGFSFAALDLAGYKMGNMNTL